MHDPSCPCERCKELRAVAYLNSDEWVDVRIATLNSQIEPLMDFHRSIWFKIDDLNEWMDDGYEVPNA